MKITCDFCKTEYNWTSNRAGPVQCALCGRVWNVRPSQNRASWMLLIAATCALLAALVFTFVVIVHHQAHTESDAPLVATVTDVHSVSDAGGVPHFVVSGRVVNNTDEIYGVPDLIIVSYDEAGREIGRQKFLSPASLLDAGASATFTHTLSSSNTGVKNIKVTFDAAGANQ